MPSVAIIGAGCSGLAAAHTLRDAGVNVTLYEQDQKPGGRATTRHHQGFLYDGGAQYIKQGSQASVSLITQRFYTPDLLDIAKPVWTFDAYNGIHEGDPAQNAEPKWSYRYGLITLAQQMAQDLSIQYNTALHHTQQIADGWCLFDDFYHEIGRCDYLLVCIPAPEAAFLFQHSQLDASLQTAIIECLKMARYNHLLSIALGYCPAPQTRPYYALVNTDKQHPLSWLAWEHEKAVERVPPGYGLLLAQMAPQYSLEHWNNTDESICEQVEQIVTSLLQEKLPGPVFTAVDRWRYALPSQKADATILNKLTQTSRLAFCGDSFTGGRVHLALEHGVSIAHQLLQQGLA